MGAGFNIRGSESTFAPAEVLEVLYSGTTPSAVGMIKVGLLDSGISADNPESDQSITAIPLNRNIRRIPIVGEVVLLLKAPGPYVSGLRASYEYYYIDIVSLQSSVHHNGIPTATKVSTASQGLTGNASSYSTATAGITAQNEEPKLDKNFAENENVKPLQPYVGDILIEGRYGNTIRLSSTQKSGKFAKDPNWSKGQAGDPILTIRNTRQVSSTGQINDYVTEDFTKDDNIISMASGQEIVFEQASKTLGANNSVKIDSWKKDNWGKSPQMLISSGRLVFNSSQKEIIAFAKNGIGLSSDTSIALDAKDTIVLNGGQKILLGTNATEPLILGRAWQTWMNGLVNAIGTAPILDPASGLPYPILSASPIWASTVVTQLTQIPTLLSDSVFTKKKTTL